MFKYEHLFSVGKGRRVFSFLALLLLVNVLLYLFSPHTADAQISPATRPHTHAGASSGGSTLSPAVVAAPVFSLSAVSGQIQNQSPADIGRIIISGGTGPSTSNGAIIQAIGNAFGSGVNGFIVLDPGQTAGSQVRVTGTLASTKACAANFTRIGPNYCLATASVSVTAVATTCTAIPAPSSDALALQIQLETTISSNNTLNQLNSVTITVHNNVPCTAAITNHNFSEKEFVATAAVTIGNHSMVTVIPIISSNGRLIRANVGSAASATNAVIVGYFD